MRPVVPALALVTALAGCGGASTSPAATGTTAGTPAGAGSATGSSGPTPSASHPSGHSAGAPIATPTTPPSAAPPGPVTVTIRDFRYRLPERVAPGARLQVRNLDDDAHTLTIRDAGLQVVVRVGETGQGRAPRKAGTYKVVCEFHADMDTRLVVR